jgi:hypothetical protein
MRPAPRFQEFYQTDLLPQLEPLETERKQVLGRVQRAGLVTGLVTLAATAVTSVLGPHPALGLIPLILGGIIFPILYGRITKPYVSNFKRNYIGHIVKYIDPSLSYDPLGSIPESSYWQSQIFLTNPDRYHGEDLVTGMVGKTAIQFSEVHSEYRRETRDSKGNRRTEWVTIFRGIFFVADFNKDFHGTTVVLPDIAEMFLGKLLGQMLQSWNIGRTGDLVRLEDVTFEKQYVVYSTDQIEARYILSPALMSRIMEYKARTSRQVFLSFVASNVYVAIWNDKDLFEPKLTKTVMDPQLAERYLDDLMLAIRIVADLDLNTRIWTKQ